MTHLGLRLDPWATTADGLATLDDIRDLHKFIPDEATGDGITVAIMDSGIDRTHSVFSDVAFGEGYDATGNGEPWNDQVGHGTAVAGLYAQLAPDVELVSVRIFSDSGRTGLDTITAAYRWIIDHADEIDVVNHSWGAREDIPAINQLHEQMLEAGVQDATAAGNTGSTGGSPATSENAFSAGAVDEDGRLTDFSSYNPDRDNPDVSAVGKNVKLARADGTSMGRVIDENWVKASGTSFSAPITGAALARWLSAHDGDPVPVFEKVADDVKQTPRDGEGLVDYKEAMDTDDGGGDEPPDEETAEATVWSLPGTSKDWIFVDADVLSDGGYTAYLGRLREALKPRE